MQNDEALNSDMILCEYHNQEVWNTNRQKLLIKLYFSVDLLEMRPENSTFFFYKDQNSKSWLLSIIK